jgi:hypothetical protein
MNVESSSSGTSILMYAFTFAFTRRSCSGVCIERGLPIFNGVRIIFGIRFFVISFFGMESALFRDVSHFFSEFSQEVMNGESW